MDNLPVIAIRFALYADLMVLAGVTAFSLYALKPEERGTVLLPLAKPALLLSLLGLLLSGGGVQWMTAGRGVIHSEMPEQEQGRMEGFQLWLNLPAKDKLCPPWYRDIRPEEIPQWRGEGVGARVIAADLQEDKGRELATEIGGAFCKVDVTSEEQVDAGFAKARAAIGQKRVLVNCAGTGNAIKTASRDKQTGDASRDLAQYISLALHVTSAPDFALSAKEADLPPDAANVIGFLPLLRQGVQDLQLDAMLTEDGVMWERGG